jgi:type 1 glutamine amidotransferase
MKNLFPKWCILFGFLSILFSFTAFGEPFKAVKTIDAVVAWDNGKAYFFKGSQYSRYDMKADRVDPGYPKPINSETWPGLPWTDGIDAAVNWGNGKAYFFKGGHYIRYDIRTDRVDPGYPKPINSETWPGLPWTDGIDAAVNWGNGKAYLFKGTQYVRIDIQADRVEQGYPKEIYGPNWQGVPWADGIDAAVNWKNGKAYLFRGNQYVRIDIKADRVDSGYPKPINNETWPGIPDLLR